MSGGRVSAGSAVLAAVCAIVAGAPALSAARTSTTAPSPATLLPRKGELAGVKPSGAVLMFRSVAAWVKWGDANSAATARRDTEVLPREGFIDGAAQLESASGFSVALVFTNSAGAHADTRYAYSSALAATRGLQSGLTIHTFVVGAISGSQGFTVTTPGVTGYASVFFATGRCEIELSEGTNSHQQASLTSGAVALHRRIGERCS